MTIKIVPVALLALSVPALADAQVRSGQEVAGPAADVSFAGDTGLWHVAAADVLPAGVFSAGVQHGTESRDRNSTKASFTGFTLSRGIADRAEVFGTWHAATEIDNRDARGDAIIGAKYNLLSERRGGPVGLAVRGLVTLPVGDDRVSSGQSDLLTEIVASRRMGRAEVTGSTGLVLRREGDSATSNGVRSGLGIGVLAHPRLRVFAEVVGERYASDTGTASLLSPLDTPLTVGTGASWEFVRGLTASAGINRAFDGRDDARGVGAMVRLGYRPSPRRPQAIATAPRPPAVPPAPSAPPVSAAPVSAAAASEAAPARQFVFEDVFFDFDRYTLRPAILPMLDQVVAELRRDPSSRLSIEGYTCDIGTAEYNLALSELRAKSVKAYLVSRGVAEDRLATFGYGEERYAGDLEETTRAANRRAAMTVSVLR